MRVVAPSVLVVSADPSWLAEAGAAVIQAGGLVAAVCPDVVSALAQASLGLADVVLLDPDTSDLDRHGVLALRRRGLEVASVSRGTSSTVAPDFEDFGAALAWATARRGAARPSTGTQPLIAIVGNRGAPGASTLAAALATRAASISKCRIALLDLDTRGGDLARMLDGVDEVGILRALDAVAREEAWSYSSVGAGLSVLGAPARPWAHETTHGDVGLLLDAIGRERGAVVDVGVVEGSNDIADEVLARATHVLLVGRADRVARPHLLRAATRLRGDDVALTVVINEGRSESECRVRAPDLADDVVVLPDAAAVDRLIELVGLGPEQEHQAGRRVQQHEDRHRHAGARLRARLRARRDR